MYLRHLELNGEMLQSFPAEVATRMNDLASTNGRDWGSIDTDVVEWDAALIERRLAFYISIPHSGAFPAVYEELDW